MCAILRLPAYALRLPSYHRCIKYRTEVRCKGRCTGVGVGIFDMGHYAIITIMLNKFRFNNLAAAQ